MADLDAAIPMYHELAEVTEVSPFLLLAGNTAACQDRVATILVRQLPPVIAAVTRAAGRVRGLHRCCHE